MLAESIHLLDILARRVVQRIVGPFFGLGGLRPIEQLRVRRELRKVRRHRFDQGFGFVDELLLQLHDLIARLFDGRRIRVLRPSNRFEVGSLRWFVHLLKSPRDGVSLLAESGDLICVNVAHLGFCAVEFVPEPVDCILDTSVEVMIVIALDMLDQDLPKHARMKRFQ